MRSYFWPYISSSLQIAPKKFKEILPQARITTSKEPALACGKRLATGAVALQHEAMKKAYARAGVDVDLGNKLKRQIQSLVRQTHGPEVLGKIGGFGGLFRANFPGMREPVLVASIDGVGTKLKIAFALDRHDTVGVDLVNHCVNDIAVVGARPLFFVDYIGCERLEPRVFDQLLGGFTKACRSAGCALLGGETAQMPGMYRRCEYDL